VDGSEEGNNVRRQVGRDVENDVRPMIINLVGSWSRRYDGLEIGE
jgi:hypothetical protein